MTASGPAGRLVHSHGKALTREPVRADKNPTMGFVHYCVFCGHAASAASATMLRPSCPSCGSPLRACTSEEHPQIAASLADQREHARPRMDGAGPLVGMTAGPFLLPLVGVEIRDVIFAVPLVFLLFAAALAFGASRREGEPRAPWLAYAACAGIGAAAVALAIGLDIAGVASPLPYHLGGLGSVALLAGLLAHLVPRLRFAQRERVLDAAQLLVLVAAATVFFVVVPGVREGDRLLTAIVGLDLAAFVAAGLLAVAGRRRQDLHVGRRLWCAAACFLLADALIAAAAAGLLDRPEEVAGALLAVAAWFLAGAAVSERPAPLRQDVLAAEEGATEWRWFAGRVLVPTLQVAAFPVVLGLALGTVEDPTWPLLWFGGAFLLVLLLAFGRQAYLVVDHRRAVIEERRARRKAQRRNEELEALTGLATTMTQTLEEAPIVEQALTVLHTAARASSSALHVRDDDGRRRLRAAAGAWQSEHPWADRFSDGEDGHEVERQERGGRQITRLELSARDHRIGWVTFVRPAEDPLSDSELELLRLLVDQMAIAVQNARDYREKLEQAVRDPLTGTYNRRYFWEALEKEVQRARRYGSHASLVLFDVDDFKRINDTHGHAVGDQVLRGLVAAVTPLLRPADSFARIGGEEFALLLPETTQLDALLVAERMRAAISRVEMAPGLRVTVSGGVGACPGDAETRDELVRRTDAALYWAKRNGKDMCAVVNEATEVAAEEDEGITPGGAVAHLSQLVAAIDADNLHTVDHSENVATYALALGQAIGLDAEHLVRLRRAALLHDIGKVAVRKEILDKPEPLTSEEYAEIKLHPTVGASMLRHSGLVEESAWVRHHHEHWDGGGYPDGLAGRDIPVESRIMLIADAFEAMTSDRPYSTGRSTAEALAELRRCAGTQFESRLVGKFCYLVEQGDIEVTPCVAPGPAA